MTPDDPRHGTRAGYYAHRNTNQTPCPDCRRAAATAEAQRQLNLSRGIHGRIPSHGIKRRLQALNALGYDWKTLGKELGVSDSQAKDWGSGPANYSFRPSYTKVAALYERLAMRLPPLETIAQRNAASRARGRARRNGWPPPLAWDDIDDINETPNGWAYQPLARNSSSEHRLEVMREIAGRGGSISDVRTYFKLSDAALEKWCDRADEKPLYQTLKRREHTNRWSIHTQNTPKDAA